MTPTRVVNKRKEEYDVYIGRGSKWGNPYTHLPVGATKAQFQVKTVKEAIAKYQEYIIGRPDLLLALGELEGKRLGCFCAPKPCHGDVLVKLVNAFVLMREVYGCEEEMLIAVRAAAKEMTE